VSSPHVVVVVVGVVRWGGRMMWRMACLTGMWMLISMGRLLLFVVVVLPSSSSLGATALGILFIVVVAVVD